MTPNPQGWAELRRPSKEQRAEGDTNSNLTAARPDQCDLSQVNQGQYQQREVLVTARALDNQNAMSRALCLCGLPPQAHNRGQS